MPCDEVVQRYRAADERGETLILAKSEPFAKALRDAVRQAGYLDKIISYAMVDSVTFMVTVEGSRPIYRELTPDLHDMALTYVPGPEPGAPPSWQRIRAEMRYDPDRPRDLTGPLPELQWRYKRIDHAEGSDSPHHYVKEWYAVDPKPAIDAITRIKRRFVRVIEVEENVQPVKTERIVEEEEVT